MVLDGHGSSSLSLSMTGQTNTKKGKDMKIKSMKTDIRFFIVLCLIVVSITCSVDVFAAPLGITYEKNICHGVREDIKSGAAFNMNIPDKMLQGGKIVKVTSSKKNVVKQIEISSEKKSFGFTTRKYGKTTFTITVKTAKNKNKKYKCNFSTVKYSNPFSSIQLGTSGNLAPEFEKSDYYSYYCTAPSEKISIRPKAGWKVVSMSYWYYDQEKGKSVGKNIQNNSSITYHYSPGSSSICIRMKNNKKGVEQSIILFVSQSSGQISGGSVSEGSVSESIE